MTYHKFVNFHDSPDNQESLALIEAEAWRDFLCASVYRGMPVAEAQGFADDMLQAFRTRFGTGPEQPKQESSP